MSCVRIPTPFFLVWALLPGPPTAELGGQMLDPEPAVYTLVSDDRGPEVLWTNPAALGFGAEDRALALLSFGPNPGRSDAEFGQALLGARLGALAVGLRRERFRPEAGADPLMGTGITLGFGMGGSRFAVGVANDQYRRAVSDSRWEVGGMWRATGQLTFGAVWRDIGSPVIISEERSERVVAGATLDLAVRRTSFSMESALEAGSFVSHRALARTRLGALDFLASLHVDGSGDVRAFGVGLGYRFGTNRGFGVLNRELARPGGDANRILMGAHRTL